MLTAAFRYILLPVVLSWTPALTGSGAPLSFLISPRNRTLASGFFFFYSETAGAGQESLRRASLGGGRSVDIVLIRLLFVLFVGFTCYRIQPFGLPSNLDAVVGLLIGCAIIIFEWRLRIMSLKRLIGAAIGSILGIIGAYLFALVIGSSMPANPTRSFLQIMVMLIMSYVGLAVGANKGDLLTWRRWAECSGARRQGKRATRFLTPASSSTAASPISRRRVFSTASL